MLALLQTTNLPPQNDIVSTVVVYLANAIASYLKDVAPWVIGYIAMAIVPAKSTVSSIRKRWAGLDGFAVLLVVYVVSTVWVAVFAAVGRTFNDGTNLQELTAILVAGFLTALSASGLHAFVNKAAVAMKEGDIKATDVVKKENAK
jgi:predicted transcriptional regulator